MTREEKPAVLAQGGNAALPVVDEINIPTDLKFNVTDCKMYVPVVTLQAEYENKLYEELKTGITIDFTWNKYRPQVINQPATNNLNYLINPTFNNVNRLFVLAFKNEEDKLSFSKYYKHTAEIKDYNILIDQQTFYELPTKNKEETYKAITELIKDNDFTTGNQFNYEYFITHYKLIAIDLSKQKSDLENQQINFIGKLEQDATIEEKTSKLFRIFITFFVCCIKMESQKIVNLLEQSGDDELKFQTKKWYIINDQNNG